MANPTKREMLASVGCVYCEQSLTQEDVHFDHVIPTCLFPSPRPSDMLVLGACFKCNNEKSKFDSFIRDVAVLSRGAMEHPAARKLKETKVARSIEKSKSELFNRVLGNQYSDRFVYVNALDGVARYREVFAGRLSGDDETLRAAIMWMVRGVYFACYRQRFPIETAVTITAIRKEQLAFVKEAWRESIGIKEFKELNIGNIFKLSTLYSSNYTMLLLAFFDSVAFQVVAQCSPMPGLQFMAALGRLASYARMQHADTGARDARHPAAGVVQFPEQVGNADPAGGGGAAFETLADDPPGGGLVGGNVADGSAPAADAAVSDIDLPQAE